MANRTYKHQGVYLVVLTMMILLLMMYNALHGNIRTPHSGHTNEIVELEGIRSAMPSGLKLWNVRTNFNTTKKNITKVAAHQHFHSLVQTLEVECRHHARMGDVTDGGWDVCLVPPYTLKPPCLVYDFGIAHRWSFDDAISEEFGCTVRAFDPTNGLAEHNRSGLIHFYPVGLWGSNGQHMDPKGEKTFPVNTLQTLLEHFNEHQSVIDFLKIDIENCEWSALDTALNDGSLTYVKQLALEVHSHRNKTVQAVLRDVDVLRRLHAVGFLKWKDDWNVYTLTQVDGLGYVSMCHELYFLNTAFL